MCEAESTSPDKTTNRFFANCGGPHSSDMRSDTKTAVRKHRLTGKDYEDPINAVGKESLKRSTPQRFPTFDCGLACSVILGGTP